MVGCHHNVHSQVTLLQPRNEQAGKEERRGAGMASGKFWRSCPTEGTQMRLVALLVAVVAVLLVSPLRPSFRLCGVVVAMNLLGVLGAKREKFNS